MDILNFKYMPIVPINHLDLLEGQDGYLILVQFLKNQKYKDFYLKRNKEVFTILDNGQYEGYNCTNEELWEACKLIKPNVVCLPDVFMNQKETIKKTNDFINYIKENAVPEDYHNGLQNLELMVIPHGNDPEEFLECLNKIQRGYFQWIGLSKLGVLKAFNSRRKCIEFLKDHGYSLDQYNYHFLGCNEPREIIDAYESGVKSMDSCLPVLYASENKIIPLDLSLKDRIKTPKDYFEKDLTEEQLNLAYYNIKQLKELINV